jgi:hypothetical protein
MRRKEEPQVCRVGGALKLSFVLETKMLIVKGKVQGVEG